MLSTSWNGKSYLFAMNGQTGRLVGELPCSKPKLAIADVLLVGQLKTANEATHADEYCGELDLTEKHDTFSHTETTVVMKDDKDD